MKALALALSLVAATAHGQPDDAPRMVRVVGGYFVNDAGYERLAAETTRLQLAERSLTARVAELEASQGLPLPAVGIAALLAFGAGVWLASSLKSTPTN